jgi:hypothetical protein
MYRINCANEFLLWSAVCGQGNVEVTVWDLMYAGSPCAISLGPLPADLTKVTLYGCSGTLYGQQCLAMKDKLNILFIQQQPNSPVVLQIGNHLTTLGISGLTQAASLGVYFLGTPSTPIQPSFLPNLAFLTGDLLITGNSGLVRKTLPHWCHPCAYLVIGHIRQCILSYNDCLCIGKYDCQSTGSWLAGRHL